MFDGANYERNTTVALEKNAQLLAVEKQCFLDGFAMGENHKIRQTKRMLESTNKWQDWSFADALGLDGPPYPKKLDQPAIANGARAIATIILRGP